MTHAYYGPSAIDAFCHNAEECLAEWENDPAYNKCSQKLREILHEIDVLTQSPGMRAAARAAMDESTGHAPSGERGHEDY